MMTTTDTLTTADRCDRCGARAYVRATLTTAAELLLCAHHAREHGPALLAQGATIADETPALTTNTPRLGC